MQIKYTFTESIPVYRRMVKKGEWKFPDYSDKCPICGGRDCPVRIGYYHRRYIDIQLAIIILIPIARYKCRRKARPLIKDRTFLALTRYIIPLLSVYHRFSNAYLCPGVDRAKVTTNHYRRSI